MTLQRIEQIESRVISSETLPEETKVELLKELATLKAEIRALIEKEPASAPVTTEPAPAEMEGVEGGPIQPVMRELSDSVQELEAAHPHLTQVANRIAVILSNMGI